MKKVRFGNIHADVLSFDGALDAITTRIAAGAGGYVVTPNVDHVCLAEVDANLRDAYRDATLSLVDGMPLLWLARALGNPLPEKISGSDLIRPLMARAAERRWRVYFLGGKPGVGAKAAAVLQQDYPGLNIVGMDSPPLGFERDPAQAELAIAKLRAASPELVLVALGCPKQELWMHQFVHAYAPALALGIGASLDFIAGEVKRSPAWMSRIGLEWLYRLLQEPRRMASRYLVRDRAIVRIAWRMFMWPRHKRVFTKA